MRKTRAAASAIALLLTLAAAGLHAQEWDEWDFGAVPTYARGDQTFNISLGVSLPTVFLDADGNRMNHNFRPAVGGTGSIAYTFFLGANFFVGGELGVSFYHTLAGNTLFIVPVGITGGWQFLLGRFEFPQSLTIGVAPQTYLDFNYLGFFARVRTAAFFRFNPEWSFGLNADWSWLPQTPNEHGTRRGDMDVHGNVFGITISARYHF